MGTRGILTLACAEQYVSMAINLAISIRLLHPKEKLAIATNQLHNKELEKLYDYIIPVTDIVSGYLLKLNINKYTPFEETMFIDADCLVVKSIDHLWKIFEGTDFGVLGGTMTRSAMNPNHFFNLDKASAEFGINTYPGFNGGIYYFKKNDTSDQIFLTAKKLSERYDEFDMPYFGTNKNDEALISFAMAISGIDARENPVDGMYCTPGQSHFCMDLLKNKCIFLLYGKTVVEPSVMHFGTEFTYGTLYKREAKKITEYYTNKSKSKKWLSVKYGIRYNIIYFFKIIFYYLRWKKLKIFSYFSGQVKTAIEYNLLHPSILIPLVENL